MIAVVGSVNRDLALSVDALRPRGRPSPPAPCTAGWAGRARTGPSRRPGWAGPSRWSARWATISTVTCSAMRSSPRGSTSAPVVVDDGVVQRVPVVPGELVDATSAGDSFVAALTDALLDGAGLVGAAGWAARVASVTVSRAGASESLPFREELPVREEVPDLPGRRAAWDRRGQAAAPWRH
ncbi:MAG: hypothetical protein ABT15_26730 [Pseudonocardia sp. SCN 73-27]|nr:MAG: hypothetical protein ABS80_14085 [Pseudonocardia sp. SCN 72-51]ODV01864.1 MAG: hypothetical protein ABT15_26730 [Pseudonocardia sp. SCN 73-27]